MFSFKKSIFHIIFILIAFSMSGCATIFTGTTQKVSLVSPDDKPVKAMITNGGSNYFSKLPTTLSATRDANGISVLIEDKRYLNTTYAVPRNISPVFWVNILFWPGFFIDMATGSMWHYSNLVTVPTSLKEKA